MSKTTTKETEMTSSQRRQIVAREIRNATLNLARRNGGHLSGQQIAAAKGIGRKRALAIIDATYQQ